MMISDRNTEGIIPRTIREVFSSKSDKQQKQNYTIYCSFIQIYNEKIYDLLQDIETKKPLKVREDNNEGIFVEGLSEYIV